MQFLRHFARFSCEFTLCFLRTKQNGALEHQLPQTWSTIPMGQLSNYNKRSLVNCACPSESILNLCKSFANSVTSISRHINLSSIMPTHHYITTNGLVQCTASKAASFGGEDGSLSPLALPVVPLLAIPPSWTRQNSPLETKQIVVHLLCCHDYRLHCILLAGVPHSYTATQYSNGPHFR